MTKQIAINPQLPVLTFGELMMRLTPPNGRRLEQTQNFEVWFGGAEANVAVSLAFQGDRSALVSVLPPNRIGDCAARYLTSYGVDISRMLRMGDRLGIYFFENGASARPNGCVYDRKYSAFSLTPHTAYDWEKLLRGVGCFYFSGVTPAVSDETAAACREALEVCRRSGIPTVCDLNYRSKLWSREKATAVMSGLLPMVDICFAHDEDAPASLGLPDRSLADGLDNADGFVETAREIIAKFGCRQVATVLRNICHVEHSQWQGMLLTDGAGPFFSPVHEVHVLEGVGGGDSFSAGFIHALTAGFEPQGIIDYAIAASVLKLTVRGDANLVSPGEIAQVAAAAGGRRVSR